jgi:hypothetical protein
MLMATEATGSAEMERGAKHMNMSMRMSCHTVYRNYRLDSTRARKDPYASMCSVDDRVRSRVRGRGAPCIAFVGFAGWARRPYIFDVNCAHTNAKSRL